MSATHEFEIVARSGTELRAVLRVIHPDEAVLWVSPAAVACLLREAAVAHERNDVASRFERGGFSAATVTGAEECNLVALNQKAASFISSVEIGALENASVVSESPGIKIIVAPDDDPDDYPAVPLLVRLTDPSLIDFLEPGFSLDTTQADLE